jgi:hypothetical protein
MFVAPQSASVVSRYTPYVCARQRRHRTLASSASGSGPPLAQSRAKLRQPSQVNTGTLPGRCPSVARMRAIPSAVGVTTLFVKAPFCSDLSPASFICRPSPSPSVIDRVGDDVALGCSVTGISTPVLEAPLRPEARWPVQGPSETTSGTSEVIFTDHYTSPVHSRHAYG